MIPLFHLALKELKLCSASRTADLEGLTGLHPHIWLFGKDNGADYVDQGTQTWPLHKENVAASLLTDILCHGLGLQR